MNLASFYVLISRCRTSKALRLLQYDREGLNAVCALKHDEYLAAWEHGYEQGRGKWSDALAVAALNRVRRLRQQAKDARAADKRAGQAQARATERTDTAARRRGANNAPASGAAPPAARPAVTGTRARAAPSANAPPTQPLAPPLAPPSTPAASSKRKAPPTQPTSTRDASSFAEPYSTATPHPHRHGRRHLRRGADTSGSRG